MIARSDDLVLQAPVQAGICTPHRRRAALVELEALSYATGLDDLHLENVIETPGGLAVVDLETLFPPNFEENLPMLFKNASALGKLLAPTRFQRPELWGLHCGLRVNRGVAGVRALSEPVPFALPDGQRVVERGGRHLAKLTSLAQGGALDGLEVRVLIDETRSYIANIRSFCLRRHGEAPADLSEQWLRLFADIVMNLPPEADNYATHCVGAALECYVPTYQHRLGSRMLQAAGADILQIKRSGLDMMDVRARNHGPNAAFNARHLTMVHSGRGL